MKTIFVRSSLCIITLVTFFVANAHASKERTHMRNARYGEIIIVTGGPFNFTGHVYNTIGLNDCPEAAWKALNVAHLKEKYHARTVVLNGPRYFLMDHCSIQNPGNIVSFDGLQARFLADVTIPLSSVLQGGAPPYTENKVLRTTRYLFKQGRTIYELISPQGTHYVMQSYSRIVDPKLSEADLAGLGNRLALPTGWRYEVKTLNNDLVMQTSGVAYVLQDNLKNSYQRK